MTEKQVEAEGFDLDLNFLNDFVRQQLASGKPDYDSKKSQLIASGDYDATSELKFTPYQQAQVGYQKGSSSNTTNVALSNSVFGAESRQEATLAVNNVKKIWGEETQPEVKPTAEV